MQMGRREGMCTMEDSLLSLVDSGTVSAAEAVSKSAFRNDLLDKLRASPNVDKAELEDIY